MSIFVNARYTVIIDINLDEHRQVLKAKQRQDLVFAILGVLNPPRAHTRILDADQPLSDPLLVFKPLCLCFSIAEAAANLA